jgi:hypothetical protein
MCPLHFREAERALGRTVGESDLQPVGILPRALSRTKISFSLKEAIFAMILNRLMDPESKVGVLSG